MPYVVDADYISARWVDVSEKYQLKDGESFHDELPPLNEPPKQISDEDKLNTLLHWAAQLPDTPQEIKDLNGD